MTFLWRPSMAVIFMGLLAVLPAACVDSPGYYGGYNYGYYNDAWPNYYEPYGFYPNTWAPNYYVAPFREHEFEERREAERHEIEEHNEHRLNNAVAPQVFQAAPAGRPVPSIPSRAGPPRGGAGHWHDGDRDSH